MNGVASTVVSSKIMFSGTVLRVDTSVDCSNRMWFVVTQTKESSSVLIYNPTDLGTEYCDYGIPGDLQKRGPQHFVYLVLPVHVIWAEVIGYPIVRGDNFHKPPTTISAPSFTICKWNVAPPTADATLQLCDRNVFPASWFYRTGPVYNVLIQPGTGSGAISYTPVIGNTAASYSFDIQVNPSFRLGKSKSPWNGWIGNPFRVGEERYAEWES
jgi:hypothetical protein